MHPLTFSVKKNDHIHVPPKLGPDHQRTMCIKAQKWPPTKLTHIVMNNSCVVPLTETCMEIGDRHYIWGQNGVKGYDPQAILITGKLHCRGICLYPVMIFFFLNGFKLYIWHTKYFRNI